MTRDHELNSKGWLEKKPETVLDWLLIIAISIFAYLALGHINIFVNGVGKILVILSPFAGGVVLAYMLDPIVRWLMHTVLRTKPKLHWLAILVAYIFLTLIVVLLAILVIPQVISSVTMLFENIPAYVQNLQDMLRLAETKTNADLSGAINALGNYAKAISDISNKVSDMMPQIVSYVRSIVSNAVAVFTAIASSVYMLAEKDKLLRQLRMMAHAFLPRNVGESVLRICHIANENFTGFFSGKIIDSAIVGVVTFILTSIFGISFAPLISVVVGITDIIPVFGPFIGAIPSLLILLLVDPIQALEFLVLIIIIQQVDGNFLAPKILGHSIGISALWVLFAIVLGGDLFGIVGMVIGVPVFATLYGLMRDFVHWCLKQRGLDAEGVVVAPAEHPLEAVHIQDDGTSGAAQKEDPAPKQEKTPRA